MFGTFFSNLRWSLIVIALAGSNHASAAFAQESTLVDHLQPAAKPAPGQVVSVLDRDPGILPPEPLIEPGDCLTGAAGHGSGGNNSFLFVTGGMSWFDASDSRLGGFYGFGAGMRLLGCWGVVGTLAADHVQNGDFLLASIGLVKTPVFCVSLPGARMSYLLQYDHFWTNWGDDMYLSQFRGQFGYHLDIATSAGFRFAHPIQGERGGVFIDPVTLASLGTLRSAQSYAAYMSAPIAGNVVTAEVGALVDPDALFVGVDGRRAISEAATVFANGSYDDRGIWTATIGVQISLGRRRTARNQVAADADRDVVRGSSFVASMSTSSSSRTPMKVITPVSDTEWGDTAQFLTQRNLQTPNQFMARLPKFRRVSGLQSGNGDCEALIAKLIADAKLTPGQGLDAYLLNPAFNKITEFLSKTGRFDECCHELARQLQLSAADTISLCGSLEPMHKH